MKHLHEPTPAHSWWQLVVIASATLILCSCQAPRHAKQTPPQAPTGVVADPSSAPAIIPGASPTLPLAAYADPAVMPGPWRPPGIGGQWPVDEYVCDGGDHGLPAAVEEDWTVLGLEAEDTIAHFDTLDGRTVVVPSNKVCLYAPRFAAVRQVSGVVQNRNREVLADADQELRIAAHREGLPYGTVKQPIPLGQQRVARAAVGYRQRLIGVGIDNVQELERLHGRLLAFEDLTVIRTGQFDNSEKARLADSLDAAITWTHNAAVQAIVDGVVAAVISDATKPASVYEYESPPGKPRLRILKLASTKTALPGDEVHFTLRFDNIGNQPIGNVTIIDNLTTRLEYVPGSAQASVEADFSVEENEVGSLVLRWEVREPLKPGDGGIIRFRCIVR